MRDPQLNAAAALEDRVRRRIYLFIRNGAGALNREDVATAVGITRKAAAFHLERLLDAGLLKAHYQRPPGRGGRGAGRTAKYYAPSDLRIDVTIPTRQYDLAAMLLARALRERRPREKAAASLQRVAYEEGVRIGKSASRNTRSVRRRGEAALTAAEDLLQRRGYEPYRPEPNAVALRNCVFETLTTEARDLICGMNISIVGGMLRGLRTNVEARYEPKPGACCPVLRAPVPSQAGDS